MIAPAGNDEYHFTLQFSAPRERPTLKYLVTFAAALVLGACAAQPETSTDDSGAKEYRTGSNIPSRHREGVPTMSPEDMERARDAARGNTGKRPTP